MTDNKTPMCQHGLLYLNTLNVDYNLGHNKDQRSYKPHYCGCEREVTLYAACVLRCPISTIIIIRLKDMAEGTQIFYKGILFFFQKG